MNKDIWDKLSKPPVSALKTIKGGRLTGMTDINPQWRYEVMTEVFGMVGVGWKFTIDKTWREEGYESQVFAFAQVSVYVKHGEVWSDPIVGQGGSMLVTQEARGIHCSDEGYKMAITDALGTAMKMLGVAAEIYAGRWDGSKYKEAEPHRGKPTNNPEFKPDIDEETYLLSIVDKVLSCGVGFIEAYEYLQDEKLDADEKSWVWDRLPSATRSAIKKHGESLRK